MIYDSAYLLQTIINYIGKATTGDKIDLRFNCAYMEYSENHSTSKSNAKPPSPTYCSIDELFLETTHIHDEPRFSNVHNEPRFGNVQGQNHHLSQELQCHGQFVACGSRSENSESEPQSADSADSEQHFRSQSASCEPHGCEQFQNSGGVSVELLHDQPQRCGHQEGHEESQDYERIDGYERWKDHERTGSYEHCQDYETVGNYEKCQDYEMTGQYEKCQDYEMTGHYEFCQDYELIGRYERFQDYEKPQEYDKVQDYEKPQTYEQCPIQ